MALRAVMLLAVCLGAVAAAEGPTGSSLFETIQNSRSGAFARVSAASYYLGTKKSCLMMKQIESCRLLGGDILPGNDTAGPLSIAGGYFETSHGCCEEHNDYDKPQDMSNAARSDKVGGCEWSFNLLKESGGEANLDMVPVVGSSWVKFGPASAICSFNDNSEKCRGPFCDGMTITMQGAMYAAMAYSTEPSNRLSAPANDRCSPVAALFNDISSGGTPTQAPANPIPFSVTLWSNLVTVANATLGPKQQALWGEPNIGSADAPKHGLYGGSALVFMGQATFSTMKGGRRVEETGHIEFTPAFLAYKKGVELSEDFVMVKGGGMKVWATEAEAHHSHSS